jgi:CBS domain-containing protein
MMMIREVMTKDVRLVDPSTTLKHAAQLMRDGDFGLLPIGENDRLVGTVTDRDITVRCVAAGKDPGSTTVREAMSEGVVYCFEDQEVDEVAALMGDRQVRRLPVLSREKRMVGIVSLGDLAVDDTADDEAGEALSEISQH